MKIDVRLPKASIALPMSLCLVSLWISSFHCSGRLFEGSADLVGVYIRYPKYVLCIAQTVGCTAGYLCYKIGTAKGCFSGRNVSALYVAALACTAAFAEVSTVLRDSFTYVTIIQTISVAIGTAISLHLIAQSFAMERNGTLVAMATYFAGANVCSSLFFVRQSTAQILLQNVLLAVIILASWLLWKSTLAKETPAAEDSRPNDGTRTPWQLRLHLACFGATFGVLHTSPSVRGGISMFNVDLALAVGAILAIAVICALFSRKAWEVPLIWQIVRGVVVPVAIVGFGVLPLLETPVLSLVLTESASVMYSIVLVLACSTAAKECGISGSVVLAECYLTKSIGFLAGSIAGAWLAITSSSNHTNLTIALLIVVITLSLGTFWVGDDNLLKKWWGLRVEKTPKKYSDELMEKKLALLAEECSLTKRETEVARLIIAGKTMVEIGEELHISFQTVRNHTHHIYSKSNIHSAKELRKMLEELKVVV